MSGKLPTVTQARKHSKFFARQCLTFAHLSENSLFAKIQAKRFSEKKKKLKKNWKKKIEKKIENKKIEKKIEKKKFFFDEKTEFSNFYTNI